ncbi:MAG: phosphate signaling complex protein PhoU [Bdellovibrionales bacterium]|nr:phosphate signaling complex protein PhoU [Bdellovibrionales bacterium]MCB0411305.1 phosphate signaling complex protein PhoU [Bdellovibrionales bacterium]
MDTLLGQYLTDLKNKVAEMAGMVEEAILISTKALARKDPEALHRVFEIEDKINEAHKTIDRTCFKLLARQSPVAGDLRLIIASGRMSVDLERMGDLACTISYCVKDYLAGTPVMMVQEIPKMSDSVRQMVQMCLDAFMREDEALAREVLQLDDAIDQYRDHLSQTLKDGIKTNVASVDSSLELYTIVRNLERLGDHATNIAEEVIFLVTGNDIRHLKDKLEEGVNGTI